MSDGPGVAGRVEHLQGDLAKSGEGGAVLPESETRSEFCLNLNERLMRCTVTWGGRPKNPHALPFFLVSEMDCSTTRSIIIPGFEDKLTILNFWNLSLLKKIEYLPPSAAFQ